ncbi:MAG: hypothetical protein ACWGN7_03275 [Thermodesulfovibrionales bacterium]
MKNRILRYALPPGPILILTLLGVLMLSALLYYRSVKIQRFLEPALALSEPRVDFSATVQDYLRKEFSDDELKSIRFEWGSILVDESLIFNERQKISLKALFTLRKIGEVFRHVLHDSRTKAYIDLIVVADDFPLLPDNDSTERARMEAHYKADLVLDTLLMVNPSLKQDFMHYFASAALPAQSAVSSRPGIEFRFISSEQIHIQALQSLRKYAE